MSVLIQLTRRHMKLYLRDKASVFFSFLSVIIVFVLYAVILGSVQENGISSMGAGDVPPDVLATIIDLDQTSYLVSSWLMAGILMVSTVTVPLGSLGALIADKENRKVDDFYTAPIDRRILALSYLLSSWIVSFGMVMMNLIFGQLYVIFNGGGFIGVVPIIQLIVISMISIMCFSSIFFYVSLWMKTQNSFGLLSTLVGTFIGFLGGVYIQIGMMPEMVRNVLNALPIAHAVTLIRSIYMGDALDSFFLDQSIPEYQDFLLEMGIEAQSFGYTFTNTQMLLSLILFGILFYILSVLKLRNSKL